MNPNKVSVDLGMYPLDLEKMEMYKKLKDSLEKDVPADPSNNQKETLSLNTQIQNERNKFDNYDNEFKKPRFFERLVINKEEEKTKSEPILII